MIKAIIKFLKVVVGYKELISELVTLRKLRYEITVAEAKLRKAEDRLYERRFDIVTKNKKIMEWENRVQNLKNSAEELIKIQIASVYQKPIDQMTATLKDMVNERCLKDRKYSLILKNYKKVQKDLSSKTGSFAKKIDKLIS